MESILFVTSTNLATNPRCVKEIQLAAAEGIRVMVVACNLGGWSQENERAIQQTLLGKMEIRYADITRANKVNWLLSTVVEKLCSFLYKTFSLNSLPVLSLAFSKSGFLLLQELNNIKWTPSLVIAHNPAAYYPAYRFAKSNNASFAIDVEDYHPGERQSLIKGSIVKLIMQNLLLKTNYSTYASPLILQQCMKEMKGIDSLQNIVVNNVFWQWEFSLPKSTANEPLKLVWFSQNVDYHRGLERLLKALDKLKISFTLTLIGNVREEFFRNEIQHRNYIKLLGPQPQSELHQQLGNYDIGLAVEDVQADMNRSICLTNKIWAYFQSGLYIIATRTSAQEKFINQFPMHGTLVENNENDFHESLMEINQGLTDLKKKRLERFNKAKEFSWDIESKKILNVWNELMAD